MVKKTITGKPAQKPAGKSTFSSNPKRKPPRNAFQFAAEVTIGDEQQLSDDPPPDQLDDGTEPKPTELDDGAEPPKPDALADDVSSETKSDPTQLDSVPVSIVARTGGVADQLFWGRCVHDFAGMSAPGVVPLDYCHDPNQIVGFANQIDASSGTLNISGQIVPFAPFDRAAEILTKSKAGVPYQASILMGWNDYTAEDIPAGQSAEVNGQTVQGPCTIFRTWSLRGVAICPYGADAGTSIGLDGTDPAKTELDDGTEPKPEQLDDGTETKPTELEGDEPPPDQLEDGEVYLEEFGDKGGVYFAKGMSLAKARAAFSADLKAENAALKAELKKAKGQLSAGSPPVSFQSGEPAKPGQSAVPVSNLTPGQARFAMGLKFRK